MERFFRLFSDDERMGLVFLCLKGPAYRWFAWETERRRITDWIGFKCRVLARFGHVRSCSSVEMRVEEDSSFRSGAIHGIFVEKKIASPFVEEVVVMHLSMFDGANPESWIVQADRFFVHYEDDAKLDLIFLYLKGDAYKWFYWMMRRQRFKDWSDFKKQLLARFGPATCCSTVDVNVKDESTVLSEGVHETEVEKHSTTVEEASLTSVAKVHQKDLVCEIVPETDMVKQTVTVEVNLTEESPFRNEDVSADPETEETNPYVEEVSMSSGDSLVHALSSPEIMSKKDLFPETGHEEELSEETVLTEEELIFYEDSHGIQLVQRA